MRSRKICDAQSGADKSLPATMLCFDAHCHLQDPRFGENQNAAAYASRNLTGLSVCGCREADWAKVGDLSRDFANITPSFGLHPYFIAERTETWLDSLESTLQRFPNAHIGECGLDKTDKCEVRAGTMCI